MFAEVGVEHVSSCNAVISVGGDGTFLKVASMIHGAEVILAGINSDPHNSAGSLCTLQHDEPALRSFLENLLHSARQPLVRSRLQCTVRDFGAPNTVAGDGKLPLALNEVFLASNDPSAVSSFALSIDGEPEFHSKNSGILISTGTGSAGWLETVFTVTLIDLAMCHAFFERACIQVPECSEHSP
jgi:NAD+ kinase